MRSRITITFLILCLAYPAIRSVFAAPGDQFLTIRIPARFLSATRAGFLTKIPNNTMIPDPDNPEEEIQKYTDKDHMRLWLRGEFRRAVRAGNKIRNEQIRQYVMDPNAIQ